MEAVILMGVLKNLVLCENYPILLYPLYLITGCRKEEKKKCSAVHEAEMPFLLKHNISKEERPMNHLNNVDIDIHDANEEEEAASSAAANAIDENEHFSEHEPRSSWASFWRDWLWNSLPSMPHSRPPCVWGHCNFHSRPYLPWGIRLQHQPLPSSIDWPIGASDSEQNIFWDPKTLILKDDFDFDVSERVLAQSKVENSWI